MTIILVFNNIFKCVYLQQAICRNSGAFDRVSNFQID